MAVALIRLRLRHWQLPPRVPSSGWLHKLNTWSFVRLRADSLCVYLARFHLFWRKFEIPAECLRGIDVRVGNSYTGGGILSIPPQVLRNCGMS